MKYLKCYPFKVIMIVPVILLFLQQCTLYHKNSVSVDQAVNADIAGLKIITQDDRKLFFDSMYYHEDLLLGKLHKPKKGQAPEVQINPVSIREIHLYNRKLSRTMTAIIGVGIPVGIIAIGFATFEMDLSGMDFD